MIILQINNHYNAVGGAEIVFTNTIDLLKKNGHKVISLSRNKDDEASHANEKYSINYSKSFLKRFYSFDAAKLIERIIIEEKPEIAHIHNIVGGITFSILPVLKRFKIPIIASIHDFRFICPACHFVDGKNRVCQKCMGGKYYHCTINNCSHAGIIRSFSLTAESYLRDTIFPFWDYIDHYIFVSNFTKDKFLEAHPNIASEYTSLYNFTSSFHQESNKGAYYLSFGRLANEKGLQTLLRAFKGNPHSIIKIAGKGPLSDYIKNNSSGNIELVGYKSGSELKKLIQNASFVIVPSECFETNSLTTVESYAMGKPVIGSDIGALSELIIDGQTGFTFPPKDYTALSDLVNRCSKICQDDYSILSNNAYSLACNKFSPDVYYAKLQNIYDSFLKS